MRHCFNWTALLRQTFSEMRAERMQKHREALAKVSDGTRRSKDGRAAQLYKRPEQIARALGISQRQLERQFRAQLGRTPVAYHRDLRLDQARRLLSQTSLAVTDIALSCGFGSPSHFAQLYRQRFGHLPHQERN